MTAWRTHLSCVVVDAESGIFKILMRQEDLLGFERRFVTKRMPGWRCSAGATGWTTI